MTEHQHHCPTPKQCQQYHTRVMPSSRFSTPIISEAGHSTATGGGSLMWEVTSWTRSAHWARFWPAKSTKGAPGRGWCPGGGGGIAVREPTLRAWFSRPSNSEATNGASKRVMYHLTPCISANACGKSLQVESWGDPNLMYSSLQ